jgi:hypothetical protein
MSGVLPPFDDSTFRNRIDDALAVVRRVSLHRILFYYCVLFFAHFFLLYNWLADFYDPRSSCEKGVDYEQIIGSTIGR